MTGSKFITVEGIEGVGKSTHSRTLCEYLRDRGIDVLATREPGGTRLGERIRGLLLDAGEPPMHPESELLLIFGARAEHLHQVVLPALAAGRWVVCDRFTDATYAYQGGGRGISYPRIAALEQWVQNDLRPHVTVLLDADVQVALSRVRTRSAEDRFERESLDFFTRVRHAYLELATREPRRFRVVDANGPLQDVRRRIVAVCEGLIAAE